MLSDQTGGVGLGRRVVRLCPKPAAKAGREFCRGRPDVRVVAHTRLPLTRADEAVRVRAERFLEELNGRRHQTDERGTNALRLELAGEGQIDLGPPDAENDVWLKVSHVNH